ncbi:MAG: TPM domain-containing protein [Acidobacteriota bacterium]
MKKKILIILFLFISLSLQSIDFPELKGRVNDYAGILDPTEENNLELLLRDLENKTSAQVVLLTIKSLEGNTIEDYSIRLTEQKDWKIGQKGLDNGVILLISMAERKLRIEVGYGLEPSLTDLKSSYIIRNLIVPKFKEGDYYEGILRGIAQISGIITKESDISREDLKQFTKKKKKSIPWPFIIFIIVFFILPMFSKNKGGGGSIFWGGGFGGGSSGGGFGGFSGGGGSFGGGGSSGGW